MLAAFFVVTDPVTHPGHPMGQWLFGALAASITFAIRAWGGYPDGIAFGVLIANAATPFLDALGRGRGACAMKPLISLTAIGALCAVLLAGTYAFTKDVIQANREAHAWRVAFDLTGGAFPTVDLRWDGDHIDLPNGYSLRRSTVNGYAGAIDLLAAFRPGGDAGQHACRGARHQPPGNAGAWRLCRHGPQSLDTSVFTPATAAGRCGNRRHDHQRGGQARRIGIDSVRGRTVSAGTFASAAIERNPAWGSTAWPLSAVGREQQPSQRTRAGPGKRLRHARLEPSHLGSTPMDSPGRTPPLLRPGHRDFHHHERPAAGSPCLRPVPSRRALHSDHRVQLHDSRRIEAFASRQPPGQAALDALGTACGFAIALIVLGGVRELLGSGTLFAGMAQLFGPVADRWVIKLAADGGLLVVLLPPGAFIVGGLLLGLANWVRMGRNDRGGLAGYFVC